MNKTSHKVQIRRSGAYHEAAHAVIDIALGHTVRYISVETAGRDYRDICVTAVNHVAFPGVGLIPAPWEALGQAISTIAGNMAMWREASKPHPWDSWQEITRECELIEADDDPEQLDGDTMTMRKYCEAAALFGQMARVPESDELPEDAPPLPQLPSTGEVAYKIALRETKRLVDSYRWAITAVAGRLIEEGYVAGKEAQEIVFRAELSEERT